MSNIKGVQDVDRAADQIGILVSSFVNRPLGRLFVSQLLVDFSHFTILHVSIWTSSDLFRIAARTLSLLSHVTGCDQL
jgi:hypothetical protein